MRTKIQFLLFTLIMFVLFQSISAKDIIVTGTFVGADDGKPISDVMVFLTDNLSKLVEAGSNLDFSELDTAFSDGDGKIEKDLSIEMTSLPTITCIIFKSGYKPVSKSAIVLSTEVSIGTIKLEKDEFKEIAITGTVVDDISGDPIEGATVIISNTSTMTEDVFDTLTTDADGKFSDKMDVGVTGIQFGKDEIGHHIVCNITHEGYIAKQDVKEANIDEGTAKIGDIKISKIDNPIKYTLESQTFKERANSISIFAVNGKLLYSGREININRLKDNGVIFSQPIIVRYNFKNTDSREKLFTATK